MMLYIILRSAKDDGLTVAAFINKLEKYDYVLLNSHYRLDVGVVSVHMQCNC